MKNKKISTSLIAATLIGFAVATELDPLADFRNGLAQIEKEISEDNRNKFNRTGVAPFFTGKVEELKGDDLEGEGQIILEYKSRLFVPEPGIITIHSSKLVYNPNSTLVHIIDFDRYNQILKPSETNLITNSGGHLKDIFNTAKAGFTHPSIFVDAMVTQLKEGLVLPSTETQRILRAINKRENQLEYFIRQEFLKLHSDISNLTASVRHCERILVENHKTLDARVDIKRTLKDIPQRFIENRADDLVDIAAKAGVTALVNFAKILVAGAI